MHQIIAMHTNSDFSRDALSIRCPTCGAPEGQKCILVSGEPRSESHRDRRVLAKDQRAPSRRKVFAKFRRNLD